MELFCYKIIKEYCVFNKIVNLSPYTNNFLKRKEHKKFIKMNQLCIWIIVHVSDTVLKFQKWEANIYFIFIQKNNIFLCDMQ